MAEGSLIISRRKGSTQRSIQKSQSSKGALRAKCLGLRADRQKAMH